MSKGVALMEFEGNANIGLFMFVNNKFAIIGKEVDKKKKEDIERILGVPVYHTMTLATELVGIFLTGNDEYLLVPPLYDYEMDVIKKVCTKHGVKLVEIANDQNTYGNTISFGEDKIITNKEYDKKFIEKLKKTFGYKVIQINNHEYKSVGAICKFANGKFFVSQELEQKEIKEFEDDIAAMGTVNSGSNFIASGVVANKNGILIGSASSTVEIQNLLESLEYL